MREEIAMIARKEMRSAKFSDIVDGVVISAPPNIQVQIKGNSKLIYTNEMLIIPESLTDHDVYVTVDWYSEEHKHTHKISDTYTGGGSASDNTHNHAIKGKKKMTIHNGLKKGDKVLLARLTGWQSAVILDRYK